MSILRRKGFSALAVILAFALVQISLQLGFAAPRSSTFAALPPQGILAKVTTKDGSPIFINGVSSPSGSSIATNTTIDSTGVASTVDLGPLGTIDLHPGAKIVIEFECPPEKVNDPDPENCKVKTTVLAGCITVNHKKGSQHDVVLENQEKVAESDDDDEKKGGGVLNYCKPGAPIGALPGGGIGWPGWVGILAAAAIVPASLPLIFDEGNNPSDGQPAG
ncbi:MAG TPA: hypothetical protein VJV03_10460 [Pyrinomonadaceae bacterium]|nr:hypothetical protein [Pyrinomonadaceae bacterium]